MCKTAGNLDCNYSQHRPIILWVKGQLCVRMMNDFLHWRSQVSTRTRRKRCVVETEVFRMDGNDPSN